jgi:hypothetical protein
MVTRRVLAAVLLLAATLTGAAGCGTSPVAKPAASPTPLYSVVTPPTLAATAPVPAPTGPVVLTIEGADHPNVGDTLQFDMETLEKLGTVGYTAYDRQAFGKNVAFTGPLLSTVLDAAGVHGELLHYGAVNDYTVDIPMSDATRYAPMIATRADGKRMDVAHYGPLRVVYPTAGVSLDPTVYDSRWIWQLTTIIAG